MYENENEEVQVNSDVEAPSSEAPQPVEQNAQPAEKPEANTDSEKPTPFHEHPRWKEMLEERNSYREQAKALEQRYAQMEAQLKQLSQQNLPKKEEDALIARLKGIDPEFGSFAEQQKAALQELHELKEWKQQQELRSMRDQAVNTINSLHEQNKVPAELRDRYNREIQFLIQQNPKAELQDLPNLYKQVHTDYTQMLEGIKRKERESYVSDKKADSKVPTSQPKGKPVEAGKGKEFSKDPAEARQELIKRVLKQAKASDSL